MILILELQLYFVNNDPVFQSYDCILGVKCTFYAMQIMIVHFFPSVLHELLCNKPYHVNEW